MRPSINIARNIILQTVPIFTTPQLIGYLDL